MLRILQVYRSVGDRYDVFYIFPVPKGRSSIAAITALREHWTNKGFETLLTVADPARVDAERFGG